MKILALAMLSAYVATALLAPLALRADDDKKDPKITITVKIPDDLKDLHKRTHPAPQP